jgi:hypothetical protein
MDEEEEEEAGTSKEQDRSKVKSQHSPHNPWTSRLVALGVVLDRIRKLAPDARELLVALLSPEEPTLEATVHKDPSLLLRPAIVGIALVAHDHHARLVVQVPRDRLAGLVDPPVVARLKGSHGVGVLVELVRDGGAGVRPDFDAVGEGRVDGVVHALHVVELVERVRGLVDEDAVEVDVFVLVRLPLAVVLGVVRDVRERAVGEADAQVAVDVAVGVAVQLGDAARVVRVGRVLARAGAGVDDDVELGGWVVFQGAVDFVPVAVDGPGVEGEIDCQVWVGCYALLER